MLWYAYVAFCITSPLFLTVALFRKKLISSNLDELDYWAIFIACSLLAVLIAVVSSRAGCQDIHASGFPARYCQAINIGDTIDHSRI